MYGYLLSKVKLFSFKRSFQFLSEKDVVPPPRVVVWDCTRRCNLNCEHCGAKSRTYSDELTTRQVKSVVRRLSDYHVQYFAATGGEPLLRKDLFEIFRYAKECGLKTGVATNGYMITKNTGNTVAKLFDSVQISLDGPQDIHNRIRRNANSYQRVIEAIGLLKGNNCRQITLSSVITPSNIDYIEELGDIVEAAGIQVWKIVTIMPIGNAGDTDELLLDRDRFFQLLRFIKSSKRKLHIEFGENLGYLGKYDKGVRREPFFCPVGFLACCIGVNGYVRGCPEQLDTVEFREGNILHADFAEIWETGFKKYRDKRYLQDKTCRDCRFKNECCGGCWVMKVKDINCTILRYSL